MPEFTATPQPPNPPTPQPPNPPTPNPPESEETFLTFEDLFDWIFQVKVG